MLQEQTLLERIRDLCGKVVSTTGTEWEIAFFELRQALQLHAELMRKEAVLKLNMN